jgi:hypothetical protein
MCTVLFIVQSVPIRDCTVRIIVQSVPNEIACVLPRWFQNVTMVCGVRCAGASMKVGCCWEPTIRVLQ